MNEAVYWILRCQHQLLTVPGDCPFPFGTAAEFGLPSDALAVGEIGGRSCRALDVTDWPALAGGAPLSLRALHGLAGMEIFAFAGRATQLLDWQTNHHHCGRCGTLTGRLGGEFAMSCPACGLVVYPRLSPAVMVLVRDGERLLLARSPHFKAGVYSALAGFVEPGETLEQCAAREVREEVGVEIANLRYFASQPWPFPNSLMIAFFADYAGGEIVPQPGEIEDAAWFVPAALPLLPDPVSIARRLIDAALAES
jgi:NAD+ diphosphatase